jgi:type IV pilus assembly protein PilB
MPHVVAPVPTMPPAFTPPQPDAFSASPVLDAQTASYEEIQRRILLAAQQHYGATLNVQPQTATPATPTHPSTYSSTFSDSPTPQPTNTKQSAELIHGITESPQPIATSAAPIATPEPQPTPPQLPTAQEPPAPSKQKLRIGERLIELGLVSPDQLQVALQEQRISKKMLGTVLVDMGFVTESAIAEVLAESAGKERFNPKSVMIDSNIIKLVPKNVAVRNKVIPVSIEDGNLQLAMADIYNVVAVDQVRRGLPRGMDIIPLLSTESEIQELIGQYYDYAIDIDGILREIETGIRENTEAILDGAQDNYVSPTVRLVNALLMDAIKQGASDIHFEPEGSFLRLRYRIDGAMTQIRSFHRDYWSAILVRIKILSGMNIAETRNPQDGRISFQFMGRDVDFRVATQPTIHGENVVMRLLDKSKALMPLEKLGFTDDSIALLKKMLKRPEGIIIVTGPTGSGKTTSLYSVLNIINTIDVNIMTLEDPVEYMLPLIRQTHVKEGGIDFLSGIKSLMRQDPDIIFLGEVRDEDTALMAVRAAMTGHQVFTTLHTNDALGAIPRLNDIGVPSHLLSGSLIAILAQRLARKLCDCKHPYTATEEECRILRCDPANPPTIYRANGCNECGNRGYKGRMVIAEILAVDKGMDDLIASEAPRAKLLDHALSQGFIPMSEDGVNKVLAGTLDMKELVKRINMTERM